MWGGKGQAEVRLRNNPKGPGKNIAVGKLETLKLCTRGEMGRDATEDGATN